MEKGIFIALLMIVLSYIFNSYKKDAKQDENGNLILSFGKFYSIIGIILLIVGVIILFLPGEISTILFLVVLFSISGIFLLLMSKIKIVLEKDYIVYYGMIKKRVSIKWEEVISIKFNSISSNINLKSINKKITISNLMIGINSFESLVKEKLDISIYGNTFEEFSDKMERYR